MVNYICLRCNYKTTLKANFRRHIFRKNICKPVFSNSSVKDICRKFNIVISSENNKINFNDSQMTHKDSQMTHKDSQMTRKKLINCSCIYCNKIFTRTNNRNRHIKKYCKIKKQLDLENESKKMNTTVNNINKGTINNITINQFFDTENENIFDRLNNKKILKYLNSKSYDNLLSLLCKQIYFNDKFPEDKNIKCTNLQSKLCDVFVDDSFKKMQKKKAYEHLTDKMAFLIQDIGVENKEKINNKGKKNIKLTNETLDNPEQHYETINLELYNNSKNMNI